MTAVSKGIPIALERMKTLPPRETQWQFTVIIIWYLLKETFFLSNHLLDQILGKKFWMLYHVCQCPPDKTINENKNENLKEFHLTSVNTNTSNRSLYTLSLETTSTRMSENIKGSNLISTPKPTGEESRTVFYRGESIVNDGDEREECLSSVSYDEEKEEYNDTDISSDDSSPNILSSEKRKQK